MSLDFIAASDEADIFSMLVSLQKEDGIFVDNCVMGE